MAGHAQADGARWLRGLPLKLNQNPAVQVLAAIIAVAAGIRIVYWLLAPVWPYLLFVFVIWGLWRLRIWWLDRW